MTFAGTPDRVESRLVPEAGFPLDTFPVSGLPRRAERRPRFAPPGGRSAAPVALPRDPAPTPARRRARRRRLRRRPDGARRTAARDPGGADRGGRAPRAREPARRSVRPTVVPRVRDPGADGRRCASSGGRSRSPIAARAGRRGGAASGSPRRARSSRSSVRSPARGRSTRWRSSAWGADGPGGAPHLAVSATSRRSRAARRAAGLRARRRRPTTSATRSRPPTSRSPARAARSGSSPRPGRPRSSCRTPTRPRITRRSTPGTSSAAAARSSFRTRTSTACPRSSHELLADPARLAAMREAMLALARPDAADDVADELVALAEAVGEPRGERQQPLAGRRLYFVGIGGSGMSAYANIARAWGAEVRGWDARETIFIGDARRASRSTSAASRARRTGFEMIVSTAHRDRVEGTPRAAFLAELVAARPSIVVDGRARQDDDGGDDRVRAAGDRRRSGVDHRRRRPAARRERRAPAPGWLVVEGDESDRSVFALRPAARRGHERRARPPRELRLRSRSSATTSTRGSRRCPRSSAAGSSTRSASRSPCPGEHNRRNAAAALEALVLAGVEPRGGRSAHSRGSPGPTGASSSSASARGVTVDRRLRPQPDGARAQRCETARARSHARARRASTSRTSSSGRASSHRELGEALGLADVAIVTDFVGRRDAPREGVERAARPRCTSPTRRAACGRRRSTTRRSLALALVRPGDVVVTLGVGEPWRVAGAILDGLPDGARAIGTWRSRPDVRLRKSTTIGTGGPATRVRATRVARASSRRRSRGRPSGASSVVTVGLGSNLLAADEGVDALVLRLDGRPRRRRGRRRAAPCRRGRDERGVPAPRARGGARRPRVRLRDSRHRRGRRADERGRVRVGLVGDPRACARRLGARGAAGSPRASSASRTATPTLRPGQVVARVEYRLEPRPVGEIKAEVAEPRRAAEGDAADEQADVRLRVQEPARRARRRAHARAAAG